MATLGIHLSFNENLNCGEFEENINGKVMFIQSLFQSANNFTKLWIK